MKKICINNRDEMIILFVDNIAYIMADGNYTKICYIGGLSTVLSLGISKIEAMLSQAYPKGTTSRLYALDVALSSTRCSSTTSMFSNSTLYCPIALKIQ